MKQAFSQIPIKIIYYIFTSSIQIKSKFLSNYNILSSKTYKNYII